MTTQRSQVIVNPTLVPGGQSIYKPTLKQNARLGDRIKVGERVFHYAKFADVTAAGLVCSSPQVGTTNFQQLVCAAAIAGATEIVATMVATLETAGLFKDGLLTLYDTADGLGESYEIKDHTYGGVAATSTETFTLYDGLVNALVASSLVAANRNQYADVELATGGADDSWKPAGVAPTLVETAGYFGWLQTWGPCGVIVAGGLTTHVPIVVDASTAGYVNNITITSQATALGTPIIGMSGYDAGSAAKGVMVYLQISP